jgi:hypothetical protein
MSDTYQSRVFTFISKRSNRLKNSCAQGLRHLKVAVVWSSQILLYPLQLLAQTAKIFQPQLSPPPQPKSLPQPASDINIEQALDLVASAGHQIEIAQSRSLTVDDWSFIDENLWNTEHRSIAVTTEEITYSPGDRGLTRTKPIVRGLSSLLADRQLVLVTTENEILAILTLLQQQQIRRRIGHDLATSWDRWYTGKLVNGNSSQKLPGNPAKNLGTNSAQRLAIGGKETETSASSLLDRWHYWLESFSPKSSSPARDIPFASIDRIDPDLPPKLLSPNYSFTPQPPQIDRLFDLPQLPPILESQPLLSQENSVRSSIAKLQPDWLKQWWNYYRDYLYIPTPADSQIVHQEEFQLIPLTPPLKTKIELRSKHNKLTKTAISKESNLPTPAYIDLENLTKIPESIYQNLGENPDWIDAKSEEIGYSKSLIAKLLSWLDRVVLQIENWLIKTWQAIANFNAQN